MCHLVDKIGFKFAKLTIVNYDFAFLNFKRPLGAPSPPKMVEKDRTLKGGDCTPEAGAECIGFYQTGQYFYKRLNKKRNFNFHKKTHTISPAPFFF